MLTGEVNDLTANLVVAQMLFLESQNAEEPINFYINSPGGGVTAGLSIYDTMQFINAPVSTIVIGQACSMGSFLAMAGEPGQRLVLPNSRTMIHRVSSGTRGTSGSVHVQELEMEDAIRSFEESKKLNRQLTEAYVKHNTAGKTYDEMYETMKFDTFLSAQDAVDFGLADKVVNKKT
jgi:ATP-dependent Clp protease protease subunit